MRWGTRAWHSPGGMIRALTLSAGQLADPAILRVLAKTLLLTLAIFVALGWALWFGVGWAVAALGWSDTAGGFAAAGAVAAGLLGAWLLFRAVAISVLGLFAEEVVVAVERRYYPHALATARAPRFDVAVRMSLASAGRAILYNLLALPLYLVLLVTGVGSAILFAVLNGWLLGRDLGEMVAVRHVPRAEVGATLKASRGERFVLGLIVTGLFVVPGVNLFAPILGAAAATHLFHGKAR